MKDKNTSETSEKQTTETITENTSINTETDTPVDTKSTKESEIDLRPSIDALHDKSMSKLKSATEKSIQNMVKVGSVISVRKQVLARNSGTTPTNPMVHASPGINLKIAYVDVDKSTLPASELKKLTPIEEEPTCILCDFVRTNIWAYGVYVDYSNIKLP